MPISYEPANCGSLRRVIRGWAVVDLLVTSLFVLPPVASRFLDVVISLSNWLMPGAYIVAGPSELALLFASATGVLGIIWAIARWVVPSPLFSGLDVAGRAWLGGLIVYVVALRGLPVVLLAFVLTEWLGAVHQASRLIKSASPRRPETHESSVES